MYPARESYEGKLALTYDDGPHPSRTPIALDELGRRVGDPLVAQLAQQRGFADRVADERAVAAALAYLLAQRDLERVESFFGELERLQGVLGPYLRLPAL